MEHEFNEVKKIIMNDEDIDGYMRVKYLRERNSGWFNGLDEEIPDGKKLVIEDWTIDQWLLSHYNLKLEDIPNSKPDGMAFWVYDRLRKYFFINMKDKDIKKNIKMSR